MNNITKRYKLIIFNKNGTLFNFNMWNKWSNDIVLNLSDGLNHKDIKNNLYKELGYNKNNDTFDKNSIINNSTEDIKKRLQYVIYDLGYSKYEAYHQINKKWFLPNPIENAIPQNNLPLLFNNLKKFDYKLALCTSDNRESTIKTLDHFNLKKYFSAISCYDDGIPNKPSPEQIYYICRQLNIDPDLTVTIGSNINDIKMAKNANCRLTIGITSGISTYQDLINESDYVINDLNKLPKLLSKYTSA